MQNGTLRFVSRSANFRYALFCHSVDHTSPNKLRRVTMLHRELRRQAFLTTKDRRYCQRAAALAKPQCHIMCGGIAILIDGVPRGGVANIVDGYVVMLAPEEGDGGILLAAAEHVAGGRLALALSNDPVLDAQPLAAVRIGPAGNISGSKNTRRAGLQIVVDQNSAIDRQAGLRGEIKSGPHADADDDEVRINVDTIIESDFPRWRLMPVMVMPAAIDRNKVRGRTQRR